MRRHRSAIRPMTASAPSSGSVFSRSSWSSLPSSSTAAACILVPPRSTPMTSGMMRRKYHEPSTRWAALVTVETMSKPRHVLRRKVNELELALFRSPTPPSAGEVRAALEPLMLDAERARAAALEAVAAGGDRAAYREEYG